MVRRRIVFYFTGWIFLALIALALNALNIDWTETPLWQGITMCLIMGILQGSSLEFVVITITTLILGGKLREDEKAPYGDLSIVINYNLLAMAHDDIDETYDRMFEAYMGNLGQNVSAVLVSATNEETLKQYELEVRDHCRSRIHGILWQEGIAYAMGDYNAIDELRYEHVWKKLGHLNKATFIQERLQGICNAFAKDFMCVHRVSRVLRKCGQYQDLMLLSSGDDTAFSYTDKELYSTKARTYGEPLFHESEDVQNIYGRHFDYTLVLDGDTGVTPGSIYNLLSIAAANPNASIIQPGIKLEVHADDTIFMHLEAMRQKINEPTTNALGQLLGQCGYFGKAMIKNDSYIEKVIGTRENPIERVPIDVLSHDTFEAAVLKPYYAGTVQLLEAPSYNYISWNIRERRWNKGEVLLSMYFWKYICGIPLRGLQRLLQGKDFVKTKVRTDSPLDFVSSYIAHSALRQMFMKPFLLLYILIHINAKLIYPYLPISIILFLVMIFPKVATCTCRNFGSVIIETVASMLQFTPEAVVGCVRIVKAYQANICKCCNWTPQRVVEEEFRRSNPLLSSLKHLWGYSVVALLVIITVAFLAPNNILLYFMMSTLFILPFYTGLTSLSLKLSRARGQNPYRDNLMRSTGSLGSIPTIYTVDVVRTLASNSVTSSLPTTHLPRSKV